MTLPDFGRIYAKQEYLTPGAADTVAMFIERARSTGGRTVVEIAAGKGEGACAVAAETGCRVVAVDAWPPFLRHAAVKARARSLPDQVHVVQALGGKLPARDDAYDGGYCIGAPSIVGLEHCLRELARVVRSGGPVVVSDAVYHTLPEAPLGPEWRWWAEHPRISADEYAATMRRCGLDVERTYVHDLAAWETYFAPMLAVAAEERATGDAAFADEQEANVALDRRAAEEYVTYVTFVAHAAG